MNIKILDSWIRDYLKTKATRDEFAKYMSLTSVSIEHMEKHGDDVSYDIEVTTNRPDIMSVVGLAREAAAVLPQEGVVAQFENPKFKKPEIFKKLEVDIKNDPKLVNRICAVALEIVLTKSPQKIAERLETSDIRSINNVVDITNYVMREIGHPTHAFDLDLLTTKKIIVRESKKGEKIQTLDGKEYTLMGGDIVADNGMGEIIDLLGVMGTQNSAINDNTKRVLFFVDNNDKNRIRKTSMGLGIRTDAAVLNEKGVDPELAMTALLRGIELFKEIADARVISEIVDIYPNKQKAVTVTTSEGKINSVIGIEIPGAVSAKILKDLGFHVKKDGKTLIVDVPSWRSDDVSIEEDIAEEVARVYGYHKIPSIMPGLETGEPYNLESDQFYWEGRIKKALKYFGFTEIYTYSMVSSVLYEGPLEDAVSLRNPLSEDNVHLRRTLVPSLLEAINENKNREELRLFELSNVYHKRKGDLPQELQKLAIVIKKNKLSFFEVKGVAEALLQDLGINEIEFKETRDGTIGAEVFVSEKSIGQIEMLDQNLGDFEFDFATILKHASLKKIYRPISKFPTAVEDMRFEIDPEIKFEKIIKTIREQSTLIKDAILLDAYKDKKTFRVTYQSDEKNLTANDIKPIREKIVEALSKSFKAESA